VALAWHGVAVRLGFSGRLLAAPFPSEMVGIRLAGSTGNKKPLNLMSN